MADHFQPKPNLPDPQLDTRILRALSVLVGDDGRVENVVLNYECVHGADHAAGFPDARQITLVGAVAQKFANSILSAAAVKRIEKLMETETLDTQG